jgi:hypothetical protein
MVIAFIVNAPSCGDTGEGDTANTSKHGADTPDASKGAEAIIDEVEKNEKTEVADNGDAFEAEQYLAQLLADLSSPSIGQLHSGAQASIGTKRTYLSFASNSCTEVIERTIDNRASASTASSAQRSNTMVNARTDVDKLTRL